MFQKKKQKRKVVRISVATIHGYTVVRYTMKVLNLFCIAVNNQYIFEVYIKFHVIFCEFIIHSPSILIPLRAIATDIYIILVIAQYRDAIKSWYFLTVIIP